ncbi:MAG: hypothetical protein KBC21_03315, partial [Candidatus Pacebacteria bacterium]|nr:hypothetical protein [Candidatus Paceibacterota bacterium]
SAVYGSLQVGTSTYPNFLVNTGNNTTNIGTSTGLASLFVQGTSALNPFTVASSSGSSLLTVLANGNVGVGTSTPEGRLDIKAATNNSLGGLRILSSTNDNVSSRIFDGGDEGFFELLSAGSVSTLLRANGSSYLTGGNVGIGTSSPLSKLHVYGGDIFGQSSAGTSHLILGNEDGALDGKYSYIGSASGQTAFGRINDDLITKTEFLRIDSSGNVGVGTTSMSGSSKFFVDGSINISQNFALRANDNWLIGQSSTTNTISIGSNNVANDIQFNSSAGTDLFTIKSNGNVGVGSTTPFAKLSIGGFSGTGIALTPTDSAIILSSFNDSVTGKDEQFRISHNYTRVNIDNLRSNLNLQSYGGDVVIGTTSSSGSRLDIYHNTSATSTDMFRILSDVGSTGDVVYKIKANGDIFTDGNTTIGTPADLAENYPTSDSTITRGIVVSLSTTTQDWEQDEGDGTKTIYSISTIKKAIIGEEALGVISTRPGILLGGNTVNGLPVAFSGRVPVYVVGEIKRGDSLTISTSTPGYAMKLTENGQSIGRALTDSTPSATSSLVMMIIEQKEKSITLSGITGLTFLDSLTTTTLSSTVRQSLIQRVSQGLSVVTEYVAVTVKGVTGYFDEVFAKDIYTETICIKKANGTDVCLNGDQVEDVLNATNVPLLQNSIVSGSTTEGGNNSTDTTTTTDVAPPTDDISTTDTASTTPLGTTEPEVVPETTENPSTQEETVTTQESQTSESSQTESVPSTEGQ